jgi:uncharacterized protein (TIGR00251 family)
MAREWCSLHGEVLRLAVQVIPNAGKSEVVGETDEALKIRLKAQPIEGLANDALVRFIADQLDVPKSRISITHGLTGRKKLLEVRSAYSVEEVKNTLLRQAREKAAAKK